MRDAEQQKIGNTGPGGMVFAPVGKHKGIVGRAAGEQHCGFDAAAVSIKLVLGGYGGTEFL